MTDCPMTHSEQTEKKIILLKLKVYALIELASIEVECLNCVIADEIHGLNFN